MRRYDVRRLVEPLLLALAVAACGGHPQPRAVVVACIDEQGDVGHHDCEAIRKGLSASVLLRDTRLDFRFHGAAGPSLDDYVEAVRASLRDAPGLILANSATAAKAAKEVTDTVPVIFQSHEDPRSFGLVDSFQRPGHNLTGISLYVRYDAKRLALLLRAAPRAASIGILVDRYWLTDATSTRQVQRYCTERSIQCEFVVAGSKAELNDAFRDGGAGRFDAWYVPLSYIAFTEEARIIAGINAAQRPAIFGHRGASRRGALMVYEHFGFDTMPILERMAAAILQGRSPATIPVEEPTYFHMEINLSTARLIRFAFPQSILKLADEVVV